MIDSHTATVFERGVRGVGVRDLVVAVPTVGCSRRTTDLLGAARPDIRILTHQHGGGQIGDDIDLTTDALARVCAHPNVRLAIVIGLPGESAQTQRLVERAAEQHATVECAVLARRGGTEAAVHHAIVVAERHAAPGTWTTVGLDRLRVSLVTEAEAPPRGDLLRAALRARLESLGIVALDSGRLRPPHVAFTGETAPSRITVSWPPRHGFPHVEALLGRPVHSLAEHLAASVAHGAHVDVVICGHDVPAASPIVPTLKFGVAEQLRPLLGEGIDLDASDDDEPVETAVTRMVAAVLDTVAGRLTCAEIAGQHEFAIPRLVPSL